MENTEVRNPGGLQYLQVCCQTNLRVCVTLGKTALDYLIDGMVEKPSLSAFQNFLRIENRLNIKKVMGRNVWMCFDSSIDSLNKHSIQCIACLIFISTVSTNKIPYSIHNSIALILCIYHLDVPFNAHTTDKVTMITVSGFLTI